MILSPQSGMAPYSSAYNGITSSNNAVLQTSLKNSISYSILPDSTDPAIAVYDLVVNGHMRKLLEQQNSLPSVTLAGRVVDRIMNFLWKGWTKESKRGVYEEQEIAQKNSLETEEQFSDPKMAEQCPNADRIIFEITHCPINSINECFCFQFPVGCPAGTLENGITPLTIPVYYYTARAFAFGENENGCTIPGEIQEVLLYAVQSGIQSAGRVWKTETQANYSQEVDVPEFDGTSWNVTLVGNRDLHASYFDTFTKTILWRMHAEVVRIRNERYEKIEIMSGVGAVALLISTVAAGYLIKRRYGTQIQSLCKTKLDNDEILPLQPMKKKYNTDIV